MQQASYTATAGHPVPGIPWNHKSTRETHQLYNHAQIAHHEQVIFVEDELAAQALIERGHCATTIVQDWQQPLGWTNWMPMHGKQVLVWPKRDKRGWEIAMKAGQAILRAGSQSCDILVPPADKPMGWDAVEAVHEGIDVDGFLTDGVRQAVKPQPHWESLIEGLSEPVEGIDYATENGVAQAFTHHFEQDVRYCAVWGKWLIWNGKRWEIDVMMKVKHLARLVCCSAAKFTNKPQVKARMSTAAAIAAIERIFKTDPCHAVPVEHWDANAWLLNTPGGIVDLRTGALGPHDREQRMTRITSATPSGATSRGTSAGAFSSHSPVWLSFLDDVTGGDLAFQDYLQRMVGYCLTGDMSTHALFFLYGTGANGKSVFVNVISSVLGTYAASAPMDTFMHSYSDRHPTELAGLRGARFVTATETEQGRRWNESRIKAITGGDDITARLMHQDFFTYKPQFKLLIAGNHKPEIRNIDESMRRRMHLIPFTITVPPEKRDPHLQEKLLAERDGILAWALQGCRKWQERGLTQPQLVAEATKEYFEAEDAIGTWMTERCKLGPQEKALTATLFNDWKLWAEAAGEYVGTQRRFSDGLLARRFEKWRNSMGVRGYQGLSLKEPTALPASETPGGVS